VQQEPVDEWAEPRHGLVVAGRDRLLGEVSGRHHQRRHAGTEQLVERRRREHHAEKAVAGGHLVGHRRGLAGIECEQHDRPLRPLEQSPLLLADHRKPPRGRHVGHHHRERFPRAVLPLPEAENGCRRGGIAGEMQAAHTLHGHDAAFAEQPLRGLDRGPAEDRRLVAAHGHGPIAGRREPDGWSTRRAGDRLGVESPRRRIAILRRALRARGERPHRGRLPVVRERLDDRAPRSAVGAGDERVGEPPITWIGHLGEACRAGRDVGGHERRPHRGGPPAFEDHEARGWRRRARHTFDGDVFDAGQRRCSGGEAVDERRHGMLRPFDLRRHAAGTVLDPAGQAEPGGPSPEEGPEAHALHDAGDAEPLANERGHTVIVASSAPFLTRFAGRGAARAPRAGLWEQAQPGWRSAADMQ